jgi:hypothetical protein
VYYGREVVGSRSAIVAGSSEGDWSEPREMNRAVSGADLRPTGIYSVGDSLYLAGNRDTTLVREGGEEGGWEVADVHIKHAVTYDDKLYAALHDPQELSGLAVKTPDADWRRISNDDYPGAFRLAGDVIHYDGSYSLDGGTTWRRHAYDTVFHYGVGSKVLPKVDGKYWAIGSEQRESMIITSKGGVAWKSRNPDPPGEPVDLAAHNDTVFCLSTEGDRRDPHAIRELFIESNRRPPAFWSSHVPEVCGGTTPRRTN